MRRSSGLGLCSLRSLPVRGCANSRKLLLDRATGSTNTDPTIVALLSICKSPTRTTKVSGRCTFYSTPKCFRIFLNKNVNDSCDYNPSTFIKKPRGEEGDRTNSVVYVHVLLFITFNINRGSRTIIDRRKSSLRKTIYDIS